MPRSTFSRRNFLRTIGAGSGLVLASATTTRAAETNPSSGRARNVLFFVSDGMTHGTLSLANHFLRLTENRQSHWAQLYLDTPVVRALMETNSASSIVTDSAAASCAWACGQRINNGAVNIAPDGRPLTPILRHARRAGKGTGLVTTARITHATPAGWLAQVAHRNQEDDIALQYLEEKVDVLLGGGVEHFDPAQRDDGRNLFAEFASAGYRVLRSRAEWDAPAGRVLGCFHESHLPYTVDQRVDPQLQADVPTLAEMTDWALQNLSRRDEGFVLQVEGGRVDHAAHANDAAAALRDQIAFDDAVGLGVAFAREHPDTLIIITTDHGTGGLNINGLGPDYGHSERAVLSLGQADVSFERLNRRLRDANLSERGELIHAHFTAELSRDELREVSEAYDRVNQRTGSQRAAEITLGRALSGHNAIGFTSGNHTGELVELTAFGPGAERIPAVVENQMLFDVMMTAMGIRV